MSLLNFLCAAIPARERVITCEEVLELTETVPKAAVAAAARAGFGLWWLLGAVSTASAPLLVAAAKALLDVLRGQSAVVEGDHSEEGRVMQSTWTWV